jgi:hypothetical protein
LPVLGLFAGLSMTALPMSGSSSELPEQSSGLLDLERQVYPNQSVLASVLASAPGERRAYFGDLHLHTSYSLDAAAVKSGTVPDDAYRYAKGEEVNYMGRTVRRRVPLDFLAVTDHAEFLGNVRLMMDGDIAAPDSSWTDLFEHDGGSDMFELMRRAAVGFYKEDVPGLSDPARVAGNWADVIAAAERHYEPGRFTTFVGFEYSASLRTSPVASLHRNVIFRGPDYPAMPFSATDSLHPEALWAYADTNRERGMDSLMIPHNTNFSSGRAFAFEDSWGNPTDLKHVLTRRRNEPLVELTQHKGTSETTPDLSPDDPFAAYGVIPTRTDDYRGDYVRPGMLRGLEMAEQLGVNPFEIGFVGATDFHSGLSSTEEDNFPGALGLHDLISRPKELLQNVEAFNGGPLSRLAAGGLTGVWADSNSREAIFDALRRREVFATSGPRIRVRLFAGWGTMPGNGNREGWAGRAYRWGVPMGGMLSASVNGLAPTFHFQAIKDPNSGNLDRIQIIKLWRKDGQSYEQVFDVAASPGRQIDPETGFYSDVGNTVDAKTATYENSIGAVELFGSWTDPQFDPAERAIYYARAIEIPTPRWATYLSAESGIPLDAGTEPWIQERAWTSPIFYVS